MSRKPKLGSLKADTRDNIELTRDMAKLTVLRRDLLPRAIRVREKLIEASRSTVEPGREDGAVGIAKSMFRSWCEDNGVVQGLESWVWESCELGHWAHIGDWTSIPVDDPPRSRRAGQWCVWFGDTAAAREIGTAANSIRKEHRRRRGSTPSSEREWWRYFSAMTQALVRDGIKLDASGHFPQLALAEAMHRRLCNTRPRAAQHYLWGLIDHRGKDYRPPPGERWCEEPSIATLKRFLKGSASIRDALLRAGELASASRARCRCPRAAS